MFISGLLSHKPLQETEEHDLRRGLDMGLNDSRWAHAVVWVEADIAFLCSVLWPASRRKKHRRMCLAHEHPDW